MFIAIQNIAQKSFASRLEALAKSYQFELVKSVESDGAENYYLQMPEDEETLPSFAQDAKFGFGNCLSIERVSELPA